MRKISLNSIQKILNALEQDGLLVSHCVGRTRVFEFNPRYFFLPELQALLQKAIEQYPPEEKESLLMNRTRPRRAGKPL
ncbi:hypothetical protein [Chrysiogenes arsenatis]|uniref:hypothetical protein n=1 Tax=Chrysiogenes arsenatis TaxID=309797 RepID=UPI000427A2CA|nr:hypothetical protein [Chrysiogenes arsenatis]